MQDACGGWDGLHAECAALGVDGVEGIWDGTEIPADFPADLLVGYHLTFFPDWLDFYRGDNAALIRKYGSLENARALPLQTRTKPPACWTGSGIQRRASCWIPGI